MSDTVAKHWLRRHGINGTWENITSDLDSEVWTGCYSSAGGGMFAGVELKYNGRHLGVMFPDGQYRTPACADNAGAYVDPADEPFIFGAAGVCYAVIYDDTDNCKFENHSLIVLRKLGGCVSCGSSSDDYSYCPHCGEELS